MCIMPLPGFIRVTGTTVSTSVTEVETSVSISDEVMGISDVADISEPSFEVDGTNIVELGRTVWVGIKTGKEN